MQNVLYGMIGTVAGSEERSLLHQYYDARYFDNPRFKQYRFQYDPLTESVAATISEWIQNVLNNIEDNMDQRLKYTEDIRAAREESVRTHDQVRRLTLEHSELETAIAS